MRSSLASLPFCRISSAFNRIVLNRQIKIVESNNQKEGNDGVEIVSGRWYMVPIVLVLAVAMVVAIVFMDTAERRVQIQLPSPVQRLPES